MLTSNSETNSCIVLLNTDQDFAQNASIDLKAANYIPINILDLSQVQEKIHQQPPVMLVLDYSMTGKECLNFCRQLREKGNRIPIVFLLEQANLDSRILCLEAGADDYLVKPYQSEKFLQLLRLYLNTPDKIPEQLRYGQLILDLSTRQVLREGTTIDLTMKEFELLKYLMSYPEEVLTREQILENVWGDEFQGESNVIEVYIRYLRLKMESEGKKRLIHTVRGVGYVLRES